MSCVYISEPYSYIHKIDERIEITKNKNKIAEIPLCKITSLVLIGRINLTNSALFEFSRRKIPILFLTETGGYISQMIHSDTKNNFIRHSQHLVFNDFDQSLYLSKQIIIAKTKNSLSLLQRHDRKENNFSLELSKAIKEIKIRLNLLSQVTSSEKLLGYEGDIAKLYFHCFPIILNQCFEFKNRVKRPPTDIINAMLSFGYTLLLNMVHSYLSFSGLDPFIGFYHKLHYGRMSLACDIMEEFRTLLVDSLVVSMVNNKMVSYKDFECLEGQYRMTPEFRKKFITKFEEKSRTEINHPLLNKKIPYFQIINVQTKLLQKYIVKENMEYYPFIPKG